ncbi:cathepsin L1-like [Pecten maximus]|uniref:cathepsin L1-like n=1 Tax=Pecten maximus TaxID=6579 RepID=UPI0014589AFB|nr:cathepsin L1-like [Pecten maximus]XP_033741482.1 cathepsin L1-like [Pecten maximus]XP_033741483.1 cathepsin L1-like [Pecten maximus]XP_033741484.1 cathepsin L1-like [Pecten maximus]
MMYTFVLMASMAAVSLAAPNYVQWFDMEPAKTIYKPKPHLLGREQARVEFVDYVTEFSNFKQSFGRMYGTEEEKSRYNTFVKNLDVIREHNKKFHRGEKSFYLGINNFTDMELEDFVKYNGLLKRKPENVKTSDCGKFMEPHFLTLPEEVDWRKEGYVTGVKNQGQCGSCWSFSSTGALEGQHFRSRKDLVSLSEQQLVDCSDDYGNNGCNGGLMDQAFDYIRDIGGLESEVEYPYKAKDERKCHFNKTEVKAKCTGCMDIESGDEDQLKKAVASIGPISVAIDASHQSFQLYKGGVYTEAECSSDQLDHGVLTVGYGSEDGNDFWIVKNSWDVVWGDEGYIKMARNQDNMCGIATQASYPLV